MRSLRRGMRFNLLFNVLVWNQSPEHHDDRRYLQPRSHLSAARRRHKGSDGVSGNQLWLVREALYEALT